MSTATAPIPTVTPFPCSNLPPASTRAFLSSLSRHLKSLQSLASITKSALRSLPDPEGSNLWYRKQLAIRNFDSRLELAVMSIWQVEPAGEGYLDYMSVMHLCDLARKLATDASALAGVGEERGVSTKELEKAAKRLGRDVGDLVVD